MTNTHHSPATLLTLLATTLLSTTLATTTQAAEYSADYRVEARYEYNDNVRLSPDNQIDTSGGKLILPVTLTRRSERLDASLAGELSSSKYNESGYDSDNQNVQGNATYQLERGELKGNAGYLRDSTLDSEFTDTGVVGLSATRKETATVGGSGFHMFTEKNGLSAGGNYADVQYQSPFYQDYTYASGYGGWLHQWTERTLLRLQAYANNYENDGQVKVSSDGLGAQAGFDSDLSEQLTLSMLVGWVSIDTNYSSGQPIPIDDASDDAYLVTGSLKYEQERYNLEARVKSDTNPSGDGYLLKTDQLDVSYGYRLTELSRANLTVLAGRSSSLDSSIDNDRDYARGVLRLDYRFSPNWYVAGSYTYSFQDQKRNNYDPGDADSNSVYLSLIWQPDTHAWSR